MRPLAVFRPAQVFQAADHVQTVLLTTSAQAFDIPTGAGFVSFGNTANFACLFGAATAVWPAATSTNTTGPEINPTMRGIGSTADCTGLSVIAPVAGGLLTMSFYGRGGG